MQKTKPTANITTANSTARSSSRDGEFHALIIDTNPANTTHQIITFANSACSDHCFIDKADFVTYRPFHNKGGDMAVKGGKFEISGTGQVEK